MRLYWVDPDVECGSLHLRIRITLLYGGFFKNGNQFDVYGLYFAGVVYNNLAVFIRRYYRHCE